MELIVNGENVLEPVNLEKNKNEIEKQRESVPAEITFTPFREKNLFFRANVKGGDLNELVTALQKTFSDVNSRESNIYDQLDTVFKTVESIHKGSIEGIIVAVKSAQGAISQAEYAIDRIKDTLDILQNFKDQLEDNTEHLRDIDDIWEDTQELDKKIREAEELFTNKTRNIENNIKVLMELKELLDNIDHLNDIDDMYKDLLSICQQFKKEKKRLRDDITHNSIEIVKLDKFMKSTEEINHLKDVDTIYSELNRLKKVVETNKSVTDNEISLIESEIREISDFKKNVEEIPHLFDVDIVWSENKRISSNIEELKKNITNDEHKIENIERVMQQKDEEIINLKEGVLKYETLANEVSVQKNKLKMMYYICGGSIGIVVIQIILNVIGIL